MALIIYKDDFNGYKELIEETVTGGTTVTYVGQAEKGTATNAAKWRIKRITEVVVLTVTTTTIEFAGGSGLEFKYAWTDRASLTYA